MKKKAFSLFELSIVIVAIAVILTGAMAGSRLINKSRLASARLLTENSVVNNMEGLVMWLESSLESSFGNVELEDGMVVSTWNDRNPNAMIKNNATMTTSDSQPILKLNVFDNAIPAVYFDGVDDHFTFDSTDLASGALSVFAVERRDNTTSHVQYVVSMTTTTNDAPLIMGYVNESTPYYLHNSQVLNMHDVVNPLTVEYTPNSKTPNLNIWVSNLASGAKYWRDGFSSQHQETSSLPIAPLTDISEAYIARRTNSYATHYYKGHIAEIIIFNRALKTSERKAVERYLKKKYRINNN